MKIIYCKEVETLYLKEVIYRKGELLGILIPTEEQAAVFSDKEAKYVIKNLDGGTQYWGSKPPRK